MNQFASMDRCVLRVGVVSALVALAASATAQEIGGGSKGAVTGAAGGATAEGANSAIERCDQALGTIGVVEDQNAPWYHTLQSYKLGSTVPVLRMMIQQSKAMRQGFDKLTTVLRLPRRVGPSTGWRVLPARLLLLRRRVLSLALTTTLSAALGLTVLATVQP
jgi:hypothetical protein